jgi:GH43 family beta-xylosidase
MKNDILTNWRTPMERQKVFQLPEGNQNLWAPEIHHIDGQWYIYFTMGTGEIPTQRMWVIQALNPESPLGAYSGSKRLASPENYYQIDGTVIQYGNSTNLYMMWSGCDSPGIDNPTNMYIAKMSNPTTLEGERILLRTRTQDWEGTVIEGPQIIWNGTRLYIIFSANHYTTEDYCLGMMYIDDLKDPLVAENWNQKIRCSCILQKYRCRRIWPWTCFIHILSRLQGRLDCISCHASPSNAS